jgi:thymidine kinase
MNDFFSVCPSKLLEKSASKELGPGNLGVLIAPAGAGKTACLINIALETIFHRKKIVHVSLKEGPEKVMHYYNVMYADILKTLDIRDDHEHRAMIEKDKMILAYLNNSFDTDRLRASLTNLKKELKFIPHALIVDGLDFESLDRAIFEEFKKIAAEFGVEIWFSALSHRHIAEVNEKGIPNPCNKLDDLFTMIMQLKNEQSGVFLMLLKDHDNHIPTDNSIRLNPGTFIPLES